jgi:hypothetical protein
VTKLNRRAGEGYVAYMKELRNAYKILVGKPEGKRTSERQSQARG